MRRRIQPRPWSRFASSASFVARSWRYCASASSRSRPVIDASPRKTRRPRRERAVRFAHGLRSRRRPATSAATSRSDVLRPAVRAEARGRAAAARAGRPRRASGSPGSPGARPRSVDRDLVQVVDDLVPVEPLPQHRARPAPRAPGRCRRAAVGSSTRRARTRGSTRRARRGRGTRPAPASPRARRGATGGASGSRRAARPCRATRPTASAARAAISAVPRSSEPPWIAMNPKPRAQLDALGHSRMREEVGEHADARLLVGPAVTPGRVEIEALRAKGRDVHRRGACPRRGRRPAGRCTGRAAGRWPRARCRRRRCPSPGGARARGRRRRSPGAARPGSPGTSHPPRPGASRSISPKSWRIPAAVGRASKPASGSRVAPTTTRPSGHGTMYWLSSGDTIGQPAVSIPSSRTCTIWPRTGTTGIATRSRSATSGVHAPPAIATASQAERAPAHDDAA